MSEPLPDIAAFRKKYTSRERTSRHFTRPFFLKWLNRIDVPMGKRKPALVSGETASQPDPDWHRIR